MNATSSDFFVSEPARAKDYLISRRDFADDDQSGWECITPAELSTLYAIVDGCEWSRSLLESFVLIAATEGNRQEIYGFPRTFVERFARLTAAEVETATTAWAQTEEMNCAEAAARPVIEDLVILSKKALATQRSLYLWTDEPETKELGETTRVLSATEFDAQFASKEIAFDRAQGWAVGDALYYRCPSCRDVLPSRPTHRIRCLCHGVQIASGGGVHAKEPKRVVLLRATARDAVRQSDLSSLALSMAFASVGYAILAALVVTVLILGASIARLNLFSNRAVWPLIALIWVVLEFRLVRKVWQTAQLTPPVRGTSRALHQLEFAIAGFLLLFALARPYLIASDASAFPSLRLLFEGFIGIVLLCHALVLVLFKVRPNKWDVASLSVSILALLAAWR